VIAVQVTGIDESPTELCCEERALWACTKQEPSRCKGWGGFRNRSVKGMSLWWSVFQEETEKSKLVGEVERRASTSQGPRGKRKAAGSLSDTKIDPPRCQSRKQVETLGDLIGTVMLKEHATRSNPDP
jgi:hypothetical protein